MDSIRNVIIFKRFLVGDKMKYLKLIRVKHWFKNILVFLPLFFSRNLFHRVLFLNCLIGFLAFSFISSIVYVINDLCDIERDKLHPIKKNRPLASGDISKKCAIFLIILLSLCFGIITICLYSYCKNVFVFIIPFIYIILNILYSFGLKNVPILDVVILVSGFFLRVVYGGVIIDTSVSKFLYLMVIFGSYYLGLGKRRNEIIKNGNKSRKVLSYYTKEFLDKNMYVAFSLTMVSYILWSVEPSTIARIGSNYLYVTIPMIMVIFQVYSLNIENDSHGDPIEVLLSSKVLIGLIIGYVISMCAILYFL